MNYYEFHIGDFKAATVHLTRVERSIYRDMIDMYYDTEQPLPLDLNILCRKVMARTADEREAVQVILDEFFTKTESGYYNSRCDDVVQKFHNNQSAKSIAGKASAAKREQERKKRLDALNGIKSDDDVALPPVCADDQQNSTAVEQPLESVPTEVQPTATNQKPITSNQKPVTKNQEPAFHSLSHSGGVAENSEYKALLVSEWNANILVINELMVKFGYEPVVQDRFEHVLAKFKHRKAGKSGTVTEWEVDFCNWLHKELDDKPEHKPQNQISSAEVKAQARPGESESDVKQRIANQKHQQPVAPKKIITTWSTSSTSTLKEIQRYDSSITKEQMESLVVQQNKDLDSVLHGVLVKLVSERRKGAAQ